MNMNTNPEFYMQLQAMRVEAIRSFVLHAFGADGQGKRQVAEMVKAYDDAIKEQA